MSAMQVLLRGGVTWVASNNDREPGEPQHVVRFAAVENDPAGVVQCTYVPVSQTARRHSVILSKPAWTWGGEMGVNDQGVSICTAGVSSKLSGTTEAGLLGADLVRLALERSYSAEEAVDLIAELIAEYGQGGAAGLKDKSLQWDGKFLLADREQAWVMDTAGPFWAAKCIGRHSEKPGQTSQAALSNLLTIGTDFEHCSAHLQDEARKQGFWDGQGEFSFKDAFESTPSTFFECASARQAAGTDSLARLTEGDEPEVPDFIEILRQHHHENHQFAKHDNQDLCRHAGGKTRPAQTCGSMIARLVQKGADDYLFTGSSAPCMSIFKPVDFDQSVSYHFVHDAEDQNPGSYWHRSESIHRRALFNPAFHTELLQGLREIDTEVHCWLNEANPMGGASYAEADQIAAQWHQRWVMQAQEIPLETGFFSSYGSFWKNLNQQDPIL